VRRLAIDFAPRSWTGGWLATRASTRLLAIVALALCFGAAIGIARLLGRIDAADEALRRAAPSVAAQAQAMRAAAAPRVAVDAEQADAVNGAIGRLNLPWRDVFDALEAATPASVALLAVEPDARHGLLRVEAEVGSTEEMIGYVERLKRQAFLSSVFLVKHEINADDANQPLRFQVEARWSDPQGAPP
jgi:Tfp pilus assembly protein PilN